MDAPEDKPKRQPRQGGGGGRVGERQTPAPEQLDEPRQERRGASLDWIIPIKVDLLGGLVRPYLGPIRIEAGPS